MTTGIGIRLPNFPPATGFTDSDLIYMTQTGATVKGTVAQLRTALSVNRAAETFVAGTNFTAGTTTSLTLAGTYGSINNIDVYCDGVPQLDCTLSGNTLTFNPVIPSGISQVVVKGAYANSIGTPADGSVTDVKVAAGSKLSNRLTDIIDVKDYGLSVTTSTLAAAVAAVTTAGGGLIHMPSNSLVGVVLPSNFAGVLLECDGPSVPVTQIGETPGSQLIAQKAFLAQDSGNHVGIGHTAVHIQNQVVGSLNTGITLGADFGLTVSLLKQNYQTTAINGEMNGGYFFVRQGGTSGVDACGLLTDVGNFGTGFNAGVESVTRQFNTGGTQVMEIDTQLCVVYGGGAAPVGVGLVLNVTQGLANTTGVLIQSTAPSTGKWTSLIQGVVGGSTVFNIDGNGNMNQVASVTCAGLVSAQGLAVLGAPSTGISGGGLQLGQGTVSTASAGSQTLPSNPSGFLVAFIGATGIRIPYYNV